MRRKQSRANSLNPFGSRHKSYSLGYRADPQGGFTYKTVRDVRQGRFGRHTPRVHGTGKKRDWLHYIPYRKYDYIVRAAQARTLKERYKWLLLAQKQIQPYYDVKMGKATYRAVAPLLGPRLLARNPHMKDYWKYV